MTALQIVLRTIDAIDKLRLPYVAVGRFAVNVYGQPESTDDLDVVLDADAARLADLINVLAPELLPDPRQPPQTTPSSQHRSTLRHAESAFSVDLLLLGNDPH